jgi:uncharacterized protein (TIGR03435 family)
VAPAEIPAWTSLTFPCGKKSPLLSFLAIFSELMYSAIIARGRTAMNLKLVGITLVTTAGLTQPQTSAPAPLPEFAAASVRLNTSGARGSTLLVNPVTFTAVNVPLRNIILTAYSVRANHLVGGPAWIESDPYDISAKPANAVSANAMSLMLQSLLEDRFKLKTRWETRVLPVYVLTVAKSGLKMEQATCTPRDPKKPPALEQEVCTGFRGVQASGLNRSMNATGLAMSDWILPLENSTRREWIDKTGLTGWFNIRLTWSVDPALVAPAPGGQNAADQPAAPIEPGGPSLFTALQEQLGLKLESSNSPVQVLVIDHVERPTENWPGVSGGDRGFSVDQTAVVFTAFLRLSHAQFWSGAWLPTVQERLGKAVVS